MRVDQRPDAPTLHGFIKETTVKGARIMTDEAKGYNNISPHLGAHSTVNHSKEEWTRKDPWVEALVHTNTVEGVFSLFKRSVVGAYHHLSAKHMDRYLDEFEFRFNNRKNPFLFRDALRKLLTSSNLPYDRLVA